MNRFITRTLVAFFCTTTTLALLPVIGIAHQEEKESSSHKSHHKPQSVVASKTVTFATISASDAVVKKATDAKNLEEVNKLLDTEGVIIGTVTQVFAPKSNSIISLNFAEKYWTAAKVSIKSRNFAKFPDLTTLNGKKILVTGRVSDYKEKPEIEVSSPQQIKIVK